MLDNLNSILWSIAIIFLLGGGLFYTLYLRGIQFKFIHILSELFRNDKSNSSTFNSLMMSLAARIGVGSLAGVALAIYIGGPGAVFWMWISSCLTSVNSFSEAVLGILYREKSINGYVGGPSYYIEKGLNMKKLARIYAFLIVLAYVVGFMTIQANTIVTSLNYYFGDYDYVYVFLLILVTFICIFKGLDRIISVTGFLVPIMGIIYILLGIFIVVSKINIIPKILYEIIISAFNFKSFRSGFLATLIIGVQRGVFSTEAGLGSSAIACSISDSDNSVKVGYSQIIGVYFTSFIICTATALIILSSNYTFVNFKNINGIEITQYALNYHLGNFGNYILIFSIIFFAFSTIIAGYYYGEISLKYLVKNVNKLHLFVFKSVSIFLLIFGCFSKPEFLWIIVDILVSLMAIINMYSIFHLRSVVKDEVIRHK